MVVLLAGGAGYIGSHTADCYLMQDMMFVIVDDYSTVVLKSIREWKR